MKRLKNAMIAVVAFMAGACFADTPQIKNVKAFQQYPWSNKVYISYEIVGDLGDVDDVWFVAKNKTADKGYFVVAGKSYLSGDTGKTVGQHRVVWDIESQGLNINSREVEFSVFYYSNADQTDKYMVIDLSAGANATRYPVSYMAETPSGGFNTDAYKTTKLVLRRILPKPFEMCGKYDVVLTKPYYAGIFEVTQKQYELVMGNNPSEYKGDMRPVETVSYNTIRGASEGSKWPMSSAVDSTSFMGKLRARTGLDFDLPTEAQWEYAGRAGATTDYNNGKDYDESYYISGGKKVYYDSNLDPLGRYAGNVSYGKGGYSDAHTTVGTYQPNAWGLYDIHGNVWEMCLDWMNGDLSSGIVDPKGPTSDPSPIGTTGYRMVRGGSWSRGTTSSSTSGASKCKLGNRYYGISASGTGGTYGFRLVGNVSQ